MDYASEKTGKVLVMAYYRCYPRISSGH